MHYDQHYKPPATTDDYDANIKCERLANDYVLQLPDIAPGLELENDVLRHVRAAYERIMGDDGTAFMMFDDREGTGDDGDDT